MKFKPEEFFFVPVDEETDLDLTADAVLIAEHANKLLAKKLAECPKVYGVDPETGLADEGWGFQMIKGADTHQARLVQIERIEE